MACRDGRPLLIVDVALPRDVDPGVREVNDVTLLDLDDLKDYAQRSAERRRAEIGKVREILAAEIERYRGERAAREVAPLVTALRVARRGRARATSSSASAAKLAGLDPETRAAVEALTQGIVNKLLHEPTVRVKDAAGTPRGDYYADALGALFDLPVAELSRARAARSRRAGAGSRAGRRSASGALLGRRASSTCSCRRTATPTRRPTSTASAARACS